MPSSLVSPRQRNLLRVVVSGLRSLSQKSILCPHKLGIHSFNPWWLSEESSCDCKVFSIKSVCEYKLKLFTTTNDERRTTNDDLIKISLFVALSLDIYLLYRYLTKPERAESRESVWESKHLLVSGTGFTTKSCDTFETGKTPPCQQKLRDIILDRHSRWLVWRLDKYIS